VFAIRLMQISIERYHAAPEFRAYLESVVKNADLWHAVYRTSRVSDDLVTRARELPGRWKFLALTEDWCGDAVNTLPVLARLVEAVPTLELRLVGRDANPDLMDAHLSGTSRAIPVVMVLDEDLVEHGWWGSRPGPLQEWFLREGVLLEKGERYKQVRSWYARDRGRTMLDEVLRIAEDALAAGVPGGAPRS